jgi:dynein heavy chain
VDREDLEQVDNLRYTWQQLIARSMETNCLLLSLQPHFADDLCRNLECFHRDTIQYCHDYRTSGPMIPGLTPREASDRLLLFQVKFVFVKTYVSYCFPHNVCLSGLQNENQLPLFLWQTLSI